jgi:hypothetical protein
MFAPVSSTKKAGLVGKFDKILTHSFSFSAWSISRRFDKKAHKKTHLAGFVA